MMYSVPETNQTSRMAVNTRNEILNPIHSLSPPLPALNALNALNNLKSLRALNTNNAQRTPETPAPTTADYNKKKKGLGFRGSGV